MNYTVDSLLDKLGVAASRKLWDKIPDEIVVRGTVSHLTWWKDSYKTFCFDLEGTDYSIRVCCPRNEAPSEGESIEFKGRISLMTTRNNDSSLLITVKGNPIGTWKRQVTEKQLLTFKDLTKYKNTPLSSLIKEFHAGDKLVLIGSSVGLSDVGSKINKDSLVSIHEIDISVSNKAEVIDTFSKVLTTILDPIAAIVLVRGGDDKSMGIWDDTDVIKALIDINIPFFTALGHAHRTTLADKYASFSFPVPADFGNSLNQEVDHYRYLQSLENEIKALSNKVKVGEGNIQKKELATSDLKLSANEKMGQAQAQIQLLQSKNRELKVFLWSLLVGVMLLVIGAIYFYVKL